MRKFLILIALLYVFCGCSSKPEISNTEYPTITIQTTKTEDSDKYIYENTISEKLKSEFNLSDTQIQTCFDNSHFEELSYSIDFVKSFDDHQVKVPADIPFGVSFDAYLWKCEDYTAILNIKNVSIQPFGNFAYTNEKNKPSFWFEYLDGDKYKTLDFDENIIITSFEKPVQIMLGLYGLEVKNMENYEEYKNFSNYIYFSVSDFEIR